MPTMAIAARRSILDWSNANSAERLELILDVVPGVRTTVAATKVQGNVGESAAALLRRLDLTPGQPFDGPALTARLASYEDDLRGSRLLRGPCSGDARVHAGRPVGERDARSGARAARSNRDRRGSVARDRNARPWPRSGRSVRSTRTCSKTSAAASRPRCAGRAIDRPWRPSCANSVATRSCSPSTSRVDRCTASAASTSPV